MLFSFVFAGIGAMLLYALFRHYVIAVAGSTVAAMLWLAFYMGAFRGDSTANGMYLGWGVLFGGGYLLAAVVGALIAALADRALRRE